MEVAELLKPRWKVIALWPNTAYEVGEIIHIDSLPLPNSAKEFFNSYPHLFKPLAWWEERDESQMPEYVKATNGVNKGKVVKRKDVEGYFLVFTTEFEPATESEYNSLNGGQNKKL